MHFELNKVDRFTVGTVGELGHRTFLIQIEGERKAITLKTEKESVRTWCDYFGGLLDDVPHFAHLPEDLELRGPFDIAWQTGTMSADWDLVSDKFRIEIRGFDPIGDPLSFDPADDLDEESESVASFNVTKEQVAAWAIRGRTLVEGGRPPCPLCGYPLDPEGHACPRTNGHRPPSL